MEGARPVHSALGYKEMQVGVKVDATTESLDRGHCSRHKLKAYGCVQEFHKCTHRRETEIIEEFSPEAEEKTRHLGNGEDNLTARDIQDVFFNCAFYFIQV
ncbi:MAG: hypothetical protein A2Y86_01715 [Candidatus Aminicenantes bacterium RBG_13_62_12]|nr:MAG: hypothetical protein A2Y86_01715 [Candidatus Aminicenantes bacterium RBG_13_62_12]